MADADDKLPLFFVCSVRSCTVLMTDVNKSSTFIILFFFLLAKSGPHQRSQNQISCDNSNCRLRRLRCRWHCFLIQLFSDNLPNRAQSCRGS